MSALLRSPATARHAAAALLAACVLATPCAAAPRRAEIQVGLCGDPQEIVRALDLVARGPAYETWLFDDPALSLHDRGVRLRLRMYPNRPQLTLKAANQDCGALPKGFVPRREGKCEYDVHGATTSGTVSIETRLDAAKAADLTAGRLPVQDATSKNQRRFLREFVRLDPLPPATRALGPILSTPYATHDRRYDVDVATLPGGTTTVEVSVKVPVTHVAAAQAALTERLAAAHVTACADQAGQSARKLRILLLHARP